MKIQIVKNSIKDFLNEIKKNTNTIINMNKSIMNNVQNLNKGNNGIKDNNDNVEIKKEEEELIIHSEINGINNLNEELKTFEVLDNEKHINSISSPNNVNENNIDALEIKIVNNIFKKNMSGKPYFDYVCEIKNQQLNITVVF